jgi:hypothetical protein
MLASRETETSISMSLVTIVLAPLLFASVASPDAAIHAGAASLQAPQATTHPSQPPQYVAVAGEMQPSTAAFSQPPPFVAAAAGECPALPKPRAGPPPFPPGETLGYDVDVMGARAGKMVIEVLPAQGKGASAEIPVRVRAESNMFFKKLRKMKAEAVSRLQARDLHPKIFREDLVEGALSRVADVTFARGEKVVDIEWRGSTQGRSRNGFANDALDYLGSFFLFRAIPLKIGQTFCFDAYAMRRMWRVQGQVEAKEHLSTPAGEFDALHLSGSASRVGGSPSKREVHLWISDDEYRLPVAALGASELGPIRAVLSRIDRKDLKREPSNPSSLEW